MEKEMSLPAGITQEMVDTAKKKYGSTGMVKFAELYSDAGTMLLEVLMVRPNRTVLNEFERNQETSAKVATAVIVNGCLLSHKEEVKADQVLYAAAFNAATELFPIVDADFIKLEELNSLPDGVTQEMIDEAAGRPNLQYARLRTGEGDKDNLVVLMCAPSRDAIADYDTWQGRQPNKARNLLLKSALLSHKDLIKTNDWLYYSAANAANKLKPKGTAVIKNC